MNALPNPVIYLLFITHFAYFTKYRGQIVGLYNGKQTAGQGGSKTRTHLIVAGIG
jgi:hypothetical protein